MCLQRSGYITKLTHSMRDRQPDGVAMCSVCEDEIGIEETVHVKSPTHMQDALVLTHAEEDSGCFDGMVIAALEVAVELSIGISRAVTRMDVQDYNTRRIVSYTVVLDIQKQNM